MSGLQAIETRYRGFRFRSRLEARWAVFFDALGVEWEYEPQGYRLSDGTQYLPDFRAVSPQGLATWYEVKPPGGDATSKMPAFQRAYPGDPTTSFITLAGDPYALVVDRKSQWAVCPRCGLVARHAYGHEWIPTKTVEYGETWEFSELLVGCAPCDYTTPSGGGHPYERGLLCDVRPHKGWVVVDQFIQSGQYSQKVYAAAEAARSARFEFGESG